MKTNNIQRSVTVSSFYMDETEVTNSRLPMNMFIG
jgi:formylglycine-generating enzyme required for sulfatase activity